MPANEATLIPIANATGDGSTGTLAFTSIPNTYTDLVVMGMGSNSSSGSGLLVRFNNDSTTNRYKNQNLIVQTQSSYFAEYYAQTYFYGGEVNGTPNMTPFKMDIAGYSDVTYLYPTAFLRGGAGNGTTTYSTMMAGTYTSLSVITSIQLILSSGNWTAASSFTLYGILRA